METIKVSCIPFGSVVLDAEGHLGWLSDNESIIGGPLIVLADRTNIKVKRSDRLTVVYYPHQLATAYVRGWLVAGPLLKEPNEWAIQHVLRETADQRERYPETIIRSVVRCYLALGQEPVAESLQDIVWAYKRALCLESDEHVARVRFMGQTERARTEAEQE